MTSLTLFGSFWKKLLVFDKQKKFHEFQIIITKCGKNLLQSVEGITKCDSYYNVRRNTLYDFNVLCNSFI